MIEDVYALVETAIQRCRNHGRNDIAERLDDALHLGSSGLEILGAIKVVLVNEAKTLATLVDPTELDAAIAYVTRAFGDCD